jgi:stage II sporulation protein AA (anti-sigma F factor antagonist)
MATAIFICAPARLDGLNSGDFSAFTTSVVSAGAHRVVLDFTDLTYMSSAGVRALMVVQKQLHESGGKLVVYGCRPQIRDLLNLNGLNQIAPFAESFEAAKLHAQAAA